MYSIPVKIEKIDKQRRSNGLIHVLAGFYLLVTAATTFPLVKNGALLMIPVAFVGIASLVYAWRRKTMEDPSSINKKLRLFQAVCFFSLAVLFLTMKNNWNAFGLFAWTLVCFVLSRTEKNLTAETMIALEEKGIRIPGAPSDHLLPWFEVKNFIVRPDFMTITRKDGKYVQVEVSKAVDKALLEKANSYSRERISRAKPEPA